MDLRAELAHKEARVRALLNEVGAEALLVQQAANFAWLTGGASSYIHIATDAGACGLLYTPEGRFVVANNIEATRLRAEEKLAEAGFGFIEDPWFEGADVAAGYRLATDTPRADAIDLSARLAAERLLLTEPEQARFRQLGALCAAAMRAAIDRVKPGMTEYDIAGVLADETYRRGVLPVVNLIATDQRIFNFRHPLPADKRMDKYAMLVLCGRKWGLVCSITRLVHFGPLPAELRRKQEAVARIDATFIAATRPGAQVSQVFGRAVQAYADTGFADEWKLHHQGGPAGYAPREWIATPAVAHTVRAGEAYAWNPSITGCKSEDTILVGAAGNEILTAIDGWPTLTVGVDGQVYARPAILER